MAVYYATKAYLLSYSEALAEELRGTGVTVTCLCPGPTKTEFGKRARMEGAGLFEGPWVHDAVTVARAGHRGMMRGKRVVIPGLFNRTGAFGVRFMPRRVLTRIVRSINTSLLRRSRES
jgi:short-subunit dehydrogenase